mgnify:CR=1 FL=1
MDSRLQVQFRLLLIIVLLLIITTGVATAQLGGSGGEINFVGIIESIIQFLQSIADIFSA